MSDSDNNTNHQFVSWLQDILQSQSVVVKYDETESVYCTLEDDKVDHNSPQYQKHLGNKYIQVWNLDTESWQLLEYDKIGRIRFGLPTQEQNALYYQEF